MLNRIIPVLEGFIVYTYAIRCTARKHTKCLYKNDSQDLTIVSAMYYKVSFLDEYVGNNGS